MNIGAGSVPSEDLAIRLSKRDRARTKPSVLLISAPHTVFRFVVLARLNAVRPLHQAPCAIVRMHIVQPPESLRGTMRCPGEFIKSPAEIIPRSVVLAAENNIRSCLQNGVEFLIPACQLAVQLL